MPVPEFAGDQDRGVARRDLQRQFHDARHGVVAVDQLPRIVGDGGKGGGDQLRVGRQRDVFLGAGMDRGDRRAGVGGRAAGDDRGVDVLGFECSHQFPDGDGDVDHKQVRAAPGAQGGKRLGDIRRVRDRRALVHRQLGRDGELAAERTNDQEPHVLIPSSRDLPSL